MISDEKFGCLKIDEIPIDLDAMIDEDLAKIETEVIKQKNELRKSIDETLDIQEISNIPNSAEENIENIIVNLLHKQYQYSILKSIRNVKKSIKLISSFELELEQYINEQAKRYRQSEQILNEDVCQYKNILKILNSSIDNIRKVLVQQKQEVKYYEYEKIILLIEKREQRKNIKKSEEYKEYRKNINSLNKELNKQMENENASEETIKQLIMQIQNMENEDELMICENKINILKKQIMEFRKLSIEIDKQIDQITADLKDYVEDLLSNEEKLVIPPKYNIIQKLYYKVLDKIDGVNKFKIVTENLQNKIKKMQNIYLPEILEEVHKIGEQCIVSFMQKSDTICEIQQSTNDYIDIANKRIQNINKSYKQIIKEGFEKVNDLLKSNKII